MCATVPLLQRTKIESCQSYTARQHAAPSPPCPTSSPCVPYSPMLPVSEDVSLEPSAVQAVLGSPHLAFIARLSPIRGSRARVSPAPRLTRRAHLPHPHCLVLGIQLVPSAHCSQGMEDDSPWATPAPASPVITRAASDGEAAGVWGATATATEHGDPTRRSRGKSTDEAEHGTAESSRGSESLALDQTEHHLGPQLTGLSLGEDAEAWGTEESGDDATRPPASLPGPPAAAPPSPSPPASPSAPESADFTSQSPAGDSSADVQADQPVVVQGAPGTDGDGNEAEDDFEFDAPASAPAAGGDAADDFDDFGDFGDFDDAPVTGGSGGFEDADLDVGQGPAGSFDETDGAQTFVEEPSVMPIQVS